METKTIPLKRYKKYRKLWKLVQQWTRAEAMARSPAMDYPEFVPYAIGEHELRDEIRMHVFKTSNLIEIAEELGLPTTPKKFLKKHDKKTKKTKNKKLRSTQKARR